jgi:hypothetical protein
MLLLVGAHVRIVGERRRGMGTAVGVSLGVRAWDSYAFRGVGGYPPGSVRRCRLVATELRECLRLSSALPSGHGLVTSLGRPLPVWAQTATACSRSRVTRGAQAQEGKTRAPVPSLPQEGRKLCPGTTKARRVAGLRLRLRTG